MKTIPLPGFAIAPSQLCFGTNMFGTAQDRSAAADLLEAFFDGGGNFLDTACSPPRAASSTTAPGTSHCA
jgi:aryl-alcohol dehydrogenase-like predicted oxidoreductase